MVDDGDIEMTVRGSRMLVMRTLDVPSVFIIVMVETLNFLHPSLPFFYFRPSVLGFVTLL